MRKALRLILCACIAVMLPLGAMAQDAPTFKKEELDQMLAPIALYPDALLSQILMASTYPLEVVTASRWLDANKNLKGQQLTSAAEQQGWDPSVASLVQFPSVLKQMNDKLDWTQRLGDAVLAQQKDVMESVQRLRATAQAQGKLADTPQQKVVQQGSTIIIQPADPAVVYVPAYNPSVVYGSWPYPSYPPYYYPPPPGYGVGSALLTGMAFAGGVALVGGMFGAFDWNNNDIDVNVNRNVNINNTNINRDNLNKWQHNPTHRKGVAYRDNASRQAFAKTQPGSAAARRDFRGYEGGLQNRPAQQARPGGAVAGAGGAANRAAERPRPQAQAQPPRQPAAFGNIGKGSDVRAQQDRGRASRQSMAAQGGGGNRAVQRQGGGGGRAAAGGGGRGGGGGGRGGGGRGR